MKTFLISISLVWLVACAFVSSICAQPAHQPSGAVASIARGELPQTITGRITRLDTKSGSFSVRAGDNGAVVDLVARKDVIARMHRGDRVVVTYEGKQATRIQATPSEK